jgi:hypothetical protein
LIAAALGQCRGFTIALEQFAQAVGAGPDRRIILVLDRAGWHSSQTLVVAFRHSARVSPTLLTAVATDVERLWPLSNEAIANRRFETLDELRRGYKHNAVLPFKTIQPVSVTPRSSDFRSTSFS